MVNATLCTVALFCWYCIRELMRCGMWCKGMSGIKLSKYTESLSMEARTRYQEKITAIRCDIDPYVEQYTLT